MTPGRHPIGRGRQPPPGARQARSGRVCPVVAILVSNTTTACTGAQSKMFREAEVVAHDPARLRWVILTA